MHGVSSHLLQSTALIICTLNCRSMKVVPGPLGHPLGPRLWPKLLYEWWAPGSTGILCTVKRVAITFRAHSSEWSDSSSNLSHCLLPAYLWHACRCTGSNTWCLHLDTCVCSFPHVKFWHVTVSAPTSMGCLHATPVGNHTQQKAAQIGAWVLSPVWALTSGIVCVGFFIDYFQTSGITILSWFMYSCRLLSLYIPLLFQAIFQCCDHWPL